MYSESAAGNVTVVRGDVTVPLATMLRASGAIACDTETTGLDWRSDRIGTIQLYAERVGVVIVQAPERAAPVLSALFEDATVQKVFHHAPFDLAFLAVNKFNLINVRCTKIASKLLNPGLPPDQHSLAPLLLRTLGISLEKGSVRTSNWQAFQLTEAQTEYAANDVKHLIRLLGVLQRALVHHARNRLYDSCCAFLPSWAELTTGEFPDPFSY